MNINNKFDDYTHFRGIMDSNSDFYTKYRSGPGLFFKAGPAIMVKIRFGWLGVGGAG